MTSNANNGLLSDINGNYVNVDSSNSPSRFGSNEISGSYPSLFGNGLAGAKSNVNAASSLLKGGNLKKKIKNITKKYKKMKVGSKKMNSFKNRLKKRTIARRFALAGSKKTKHNRYNHRYKRRNSSQRGGYAQYQNNLPMTNTYQVAGINLPASESALANPVPYYIHPVVLLSLPLFFLTLRNFQY
jgi:hypothetical protein